MGKKGTDTDQAKGMGKKGTDTEFHHVRTTGLLTAGPGQAPVARSEPAGRSDMGTDTEFGRPNLWPGRAAKVPVDWSRLAAAPRYGDRHDVRCTDQER